MAFSTLFRVPVGAALVLLLLQPLTSYSQGVAASDKPLDYSEQMPEYPGGNGAIIEFLAQHITYPRQALRHRIRGKVYVKFIVDETGKVIDPVVSRGIGSGCDAEAVRVIEKLARFSPGKQNGKAVKVYYNVPISFSIRRMPPRDGDPSFMPDEGVVYGETEVPIRLRGLMPAAEGGLFSQPAAPDGKRGVVGVEFWLDPQGKRRKLHVQDPLSRAADSVALGVVNASSGWLPAEQGGEVVTAVREHYVVFGAARRNDVFYAPTQAAVYTGSIPVYWHVSKGIQYPAAARQAKQQGKVFVQVVIDATGRVTEPEVVQGSRSAELDAEALRVVQTLEAFRPAQHEGKPVASYLLVPVQFSLPQELPKSR